VDADGAFWLDVTKATGSGDHRTLVATEDGGPPVRLPRAGPAASAGNLVGVAAAAERTRTAAQHG
jgi:hypothetical protein